MGWHGPTHGVSHTLEHGVAHNTSIFGGGATTTTMTLGITDSADPTPAGANFSYTVQATNTGAATAQSVSVAVTLDASLTYVSSSGTGWSIGVVGQLVTATVASLAVGAANPITITVTAGNASGSITTNGSASGANFITANGSQGTTVTRPTTSVAIVAASSTIIGGLTQVYTVTFTNNGVGSVNNVSVVTTLDSTLTYTTSSGSGWTIGVVGQVVTATRSTLTATTAPIISISAVTPNVTETIVTGTSASCDNAATVTASSSSSDLQVSKDATSGVYVPASSTEMTNLGLAAPANIWLCQEASGNLADSVASVTLTAAVTPAYQQAISGWTRKAVKTTETTVGQRFSVAAGSGPNPATGSIAWLLYISTPTTPGGNRQIWEAGDSAHPLLVRLTTANKWQLSCDAVLSATTGNFNNATVHPLLVVYNKTSLTVTMYTDSEQVSGTYSAAIIDAVKGLGATTGTAGTENVLYMATWSGANAETIGKASLTTLGWSLSY